MKLSVILPIIKIDDNLDKCITSILNQTERDLEIILSINKALYTDINSKYNNLKIVASDSIILEELINNGIRHSKGEYISILNQNQILNNKMYEDMLFQRADICMCSYIENNVKKKQEIFSKLASIIKIDDNIYNKMFKRKLVINNYFSLDKVIPNKLFIYKAVALANTFGFVHNTSYSTIKKDDNFDITNIYKTFDEIFKYYKIKNLYEKNKSRLEYVCATELLGNTFKTLRKIGNKELLDKNWEYLEDNFPNWRKNFYIRRMPGIRNLGIRITNKYIYDLKSKIRMVIK